ncbi:MAG: TatD family hydrolase [bacterium]|nr:TatD family hydrolase [bacterium]
MKIIDTHCHLDDEALFSIRREIVEKSKQNSVVAVFNTADSLSSFSRVLTLENENPGFSFSVLGIHPEFALKEEDYFKEAYQRIREEKDHIKAIGEIGLDYHYDKSDETKASQKRRFIEQIELAKELSLPIVIHARDADFDTFDIIRKTKPRRIDLHCCSASVELLREYRKLDTEVYIGIGGVSTFKNAKTLFKVIEEMPLEMMLTETDCPYLAPAPFRGERNDPSYLPYIVRRIAEIKGLEVEEVAACLYENAVRFYGLSREVF